MKNVLIAVLLLAVGLAGCSSPAASPTEAAPPTEESLPTATLPPTEAPTNTPEPTVDLAATKAAASTEQAASVVADIKEELTALGLATEGSLFYVQGEPIAVTVNYQEGDGLLEDAGIGSVADFALSIDVNWETKTGISGCGIVFRAEDDLDRGQQIRVFTTRLSGAPYWSIDLYKYGEWQALLFEDFNTSIKDGQGSTNHYLIVAQGLNVIVYANGTRIGATTLPAARTTGGFAYFTWQDSGISTCTFSNAVVWEFPAE